MKIGKMGNLGIKKVEEGKTSLRERERALIQ
jgi:hypothetical protein